MEQRRPLRPCAPRAPHLFHRRHGRLRRLGGHVQRALDDGHPVIVNGIGLVSCCARVTHARADGQRAGGMRTGRQGTGMPAAACDCTRPSADGSILPAMRPLRAHSSCVSAGSSSSPDCGSACSVTSALSSWRLRASPGATAGQQLLKRCSAAAAARPSSAAQRRDAAHARARETERDSKRARLPRRARASPSRART